MKQRDRVKRLQLFLYTTGRMMPPSNLNRYARGYPGEYYKKTTIKDGKKQKWWHRKIHLTCEKCDGFGSVYTGTYEPGHGGYDTCPSCNGLMWSKKSYRI